MQTIVSSALRHLEQNVHCPCHVLPPGESLGVYATWHAWTDTGPMDVHFLLEVASVIKYFVSELGKSCDLCVLIIAKHLLLL